MNPRVDYSLYLVTDSKLARTRSTVDLVSAALRGGVTMVQYREKAASTRQMIEEGLALLDLCHAHGVSLIVNDRVDVALAVNADGVHVGDDDLPVALARKMIGYGKLVGASADSPEKALTAIAEGADYLGVGAIFATASKLDAGDPIGLTGLLQIVRVSTVPIVGIAGITAQNAASVIRSGASGVAVISAIMSAPDAEEAARELRRAVDVAKQN